MMDVYPLILERHLDDRIWGGQRLAPFLQLPPPYPERIAESWQVYDSNRVLNGPLAGMTLAQVTRDIGEKLVGTLSPPRYGVDFPLLAKFIDAQEDLSIQVHPDDAYAHRVETETGFYGKSEAWYILEAESNAELLFHLERPVNRDDFRAAVDAQTLPTLLHRRPVQPGDTVYVPAGTVHTINAGIMLFEIQQKSDLTYRIYDYGRPRPLHLEKALDVIAFDQPPPPPVKPLALNDDASRVLLLGTRHFAMERWCVDSSVSASTRSTSLEILTATDGSGSLSWEHDAIDIERGDSLVLPSALGPYEISTRDGLTLLRCFVADPEQDLRLPLVEQGYTKTQIAGVLY